MITLTIDGFDVLPVKTMVFSGGEVQVRLAERGSFVCAVTAEIRADIRSSDDVMELLMVTDAVRRRFGPLVEIHLRMPYLPYARQDRVCFEGEALSLAVFCDLINAQRYATVEVWDCHSDVGLALLHHVVNVPAEKLIGKLAFDDKTLVVAPDAGAVRRAGACARALGLKMIHAEKRRNPDTGEITGTRIAEANIFVDRPDFLIVDDICDGGRTFIELAKVLKLAGAGDIDLYVTHGIFSRGFGTLGPLFKHIFVANLFPPESLPPDNVIVIGG
jgi:ribose-phosphate pyrophosphokinase